MTNTQRATFLLLTIIAGEIGAQRVDTVVVSETPRCAACTIQYELVATINTRNDTVLPGPTSRIWRDSSGRYFAVAASSRQLIAYSNDGRYITALGKHGEGPGEFIRITGVAFGANDTIYVGDTSGWAAVFSPTLQFVRAFSMQGRGALSMMALPADQLIYFGTGSTQATRAQPLHRVSTSGQNAYSFGGDRIRDPSCGECGMRTIASTPTPSRRMWVSYFTRYQLEEWSATGQLIRVFKRDTEWFPPRDFDHPAYTRRDSTPQLRAATHLAFFRRAKAIPEQFAIDASGRLWWHYLAIEHPTGPGYIVEVLDPNSGALIASMPTARQQWINGDYAWRVTQDADGFVTFTVHRMELRGAGAGL